MYALGENPLFADALGGLPPVTCSLARWRTTPEAAAAFFRSALLCLEAAWAPVLRRAGLPYSPPGLVAPAGSTADSPCPDDTTLRTPYYCPANNTIYMPFGSLEIDYFGAHPGVYLAVLAHEFGHHVQAVSGVDGAYTSAARKAGYDSPTGLELSRRLELQAQCFSGMFLAATANRGSVDGNIVREARTSEYRGDQRGERRDHGTPAHNTGWWNQGFEKAVTWQCNTWKAPADTVT